MDEDKMLDDYLDTMGYKPEKDVNGYREFVRGSYGFAMYKCKIAINQLRHSIDNAYSDLLKALSRRKRK